MSGAISCETMGGRIQPKKIISGHKKIKQGWFLNLQLPLIIGFIFLGNQRVTWFFLDMVVLYGLFKILQGKMLPKISREYGWLFFSLIIGVFVFWAGNFFVHGFTTIGILKSYYYFRPLILIIIFAYLLEAQLNAVEKFFRIVAKLLLLQFVCNIPFMYYQYVVNPLDIDNITGFFGEGTTHVAGFTWFFLLYLHIALRTPFLLILLVYCCMLFLAGISDNKFFILVSPCFLLAIFKYYYYDKAIYRYIKYAFIILGILFVFYYSVFIMEEKTYRMAWGIFISIISGTILESTERGQLILYLLGLDSTFQFGNGTGILSKVFFLTGSNIYKTVGHLNMNDFLVISYELGLWFFIELLCMYVVFISLMFSKKNRATTFILLFLAVLICFCYTTFLSDPRLIYFFILLVVAIGTFSKKKQTDGVKRALGQRMSTSDI